MPINIPKDRLSYNHNWVLLDVDVSRIGVRPQPSYNNDFMYLLNAGTQVRGKLYCQGYSTEALEDMIASGAYKNSQVFVILKDRPGCIAVIGKLGDRILCEANEHAKQQRAAQIDREIEETRQRIRANREAQRARHASHVDTFLSMFTRHPQTVSSDSDRDQKLDELKKRAAYLQQYCNSSNPEYYNPYEWNELQNVNEQIRSLQ